VHEQDKLERHKLKKTKKKNSNPQKFNKKKMALTPGAFGPVTWEEMDNLVFSFPVQPLMETQTAMLNYLDNLKFLLPCLGCRSHWAHILLTNPPIVTSRDELVTWYVAVRNLVNTHVPNGKQVSKEQALENFRRKTTATQSVIVYLDDKGQVVHSTKPVANIKLGNSSNISNTNNSGYLPQINNGTMIAIAVGVILLAVAVIVMWRRFATKQQQPQEKENTSGFSQPLPVARNRRMLQGQPQNPQSSYFINYQHSSVPKIKSRNSKTKASTVL
jgi:hypothetical protein